jgi:7-carboxy-7-deazaguanine synthase
LSAAEKHIVLQWQVPMSPFSMPPSTSLSGAPVQEIFSSIQGEGIFVGKRQIFVRFAHCHLSCAYCDTPMQSVNHNCWIETPIGTGQFKQLENPVTPDALVTEIRKLIQHLPHHSVSFTGGEPLLYSRFLAGVLPQIQCHLPTYLETSGTQPELLKPLLPWLNVVAMDIKLPSATKEPFRLEEHALFYRLIAQKPDITCFIKLVFNEETTLDELLWVSEIVTERQTPIILQPETDLETGRLKFSSQQLVTIERFLGQYFEDVRVIPQTHKLLKVL